MCMNSRILTKLERNHRNQAILLESRSLGPQRAKIGRNLSTYGNIATSLGIEDPGSSASRWETKGWMTI